MQGNVRKLLRDPDNLDFRPMANSKLSAGPYGMESQQNGGVYWIPGRQSLSSSMPIPPNSTNTAKCTAHLMWLAGYNAASHHMYFSDSIEAVYHANTSSLEFKLDMKMPSNIQEPLNHR